MQFFSLNEKKNNPLNFTQSFYNKMYRFTIVFLNSHLKMYLKLHYKIFLDKISIEYNIYAFATYVYSKINSFNFIIILIVNVEFL